MKAKDRSTVLCLFMCVRRVTSPPERDAKPHQSLGLEIVAIFFFFKDNLKHFLFCYWTCWSKKPKASRAQSAVTRCTVHINYFPQSTVFVAYLHSQSATLFLFSFLNPHFCVNITILHLYCFVGYFTSCTRCFIFPVLHCEVATIFQALQKLR